jgi:hypothetical protein
MFTKINNIKIEYSFEQGITVKVNGPDDLYLVELREYIPGEDKPKYVECYTISDKINGYFNTFYYGAEFYGDYEILVYKTDYDYGLVKIFTHRFDDRDKIVEFDLVTNDYGEAKLWSERVNKYIRIHGCRPVVKSKFPQINKKYPTYYSSDGLQRYKKYRIGRFPKVSTDFKSIEKKHEGFLWFSAWKIFWSYQHPRSWNFLNSQQIVDDILGL